MPPGRRRPGDLVDARRDKQVVALRVFLDLDTATTAKALGIAQGTVRALLAQAMAALRTTFDTPEQKERSR